MSSSSDSPASTSLWKYRNQEVCQWASHGTSRIDRTASSEVLFTPYVPIAAPLTYIVGQGRAYCDAVPLWIAGSANLSFRIYWFRMPVLSVGPLKISQVPIFSETMIRCRKSDSVSYLQWFVILLVESVGGRFHRMKIQVVATINTAYLSHIELYLTPRHRRRQEYTATSQVAKYRSKVFPVSVNKHVSIFVKCRLKS